MLEHYEQVVKRLGLALTAAPATVYVFVMHTAIQLAVIYQRLDRTKSKIRYYTTTQRTPEIELSDNCM